MTNHNDSSNIQTNDQHADPGTGELSMTSTNAMTAIAGTNGYQQQVSIDPDQPLLLSVSNASGEVRVSTSDQAGVWVVVRRTDGQGGDEPEEIPVTVDVDGNSISIHPDWGVAGGLASLARKIKDQLQNGLNTADWDISKFRLNPDLNYDIRVEIPRKLVAGSKVVTKTASGKLSVSDVEADVVAATASGRIRLNNIRGTITTNSASGSIAVEEAYGSLEANSASGSVTVEGGEAWTALRTVSGKIAIDRFTMKNARLATVSGSVVANVTADNAQDYSISTVSGSVKLNLSVPATSLTTLTSKSASGSAKADGDFIADGKRRWRAGAGTAGPAFNVKTVSGSLHAVAKADPGVTARNEPLPVAHEPSDDDVASHGWNHAESGHDFETHVEGMTSWAKDFAKDFAKGFSQTPAPPEAPVPPTPAVPATPAVPPMPPMSTDEQQAAIDAQQAAADAQQAIVDGQQAAADAQQAVADAQQASVDAQQAAADAQRDSTTTGAIPAQPWTWSTGSGSTPPSGPGSSSTGQQTAPIAQEPARDATVTQSAGETSESRESERLRVLEALERGEIDIDEALAKLDTDDAQGA